MCVIEEKFRLSFVSSSLTESQCGTLLDCSLDPFHLQNQLCHQTVNEQTACQLGACKQKMLWATIEMFFS